MSWGRGRNGGEDATSQPAGHMSLVKNEFHLADFEIRTFPCHCHLDTDSYSSSSGFEPLIHFFSKKKKFIYFGPIDDELLGGITAAKSSRTWW